MSNLQPIFGKIYILLQGVE